MNTGMLKAYHNSALTLHGRDGKQADPPEEDDYRCFSARLLPLGECFLSICKVKRYVQKVNAQGSRRRISFRDKKQVARGDWLPEGGIRKRVIHPFIRI
jgi:hypothetical protein